MPDLVPLASQPVDAVEALLDRAFEPERRQRTAYRLREGAAMIEPLSFAAIEGGVLVGSIQCWPVMLAGDAGGEWALVMIGPVAVDPARQHDGIGRRLMACALAAAAAVRRDGALMLIGDPDYYGRFFGFSAERTGGWRLPGPVERHRLLARGDAVPAVAGVLVPRLGVAA